MITSTRPEKDWVPSLKRLVGQAHHLTSKVSGIAPLSAQGLRHLSNIENPQNHRMESEWQVPLFRPSL